MELKMIIKIATCLLALSFFTACESTSTASRQTLAQRVAANNGLDSMNRPRPRKVPKIFPRKVRLDPNRNPGLLPTPLLRANAAAGLSCS